MSHSADSFDNLPRTIQRLIDKAFDLAASSAPRKQPDTVHVERFADYHEDTAAGGFLVDVEPESGLSEEEAIPNYIPLSLVPDTLHRLNLPSDDDQILSVFRNAASGWSSATNSIDESHVSGGLISRDDWRSVCAVLLEHADDRVKGSNKDSDDHDESVDGGSDYDYAFDDEDSDEDYQEDADATTRSRGSRIRHMGSGLGAPEEYITLTKRQQETCLETYSLFFPSVPLTDLPKQNIMISDIQRVAGLLGEKLTAEEVSDAFG